MLGFLRCRSLHTVEGIGNLHGLWPARRGSDWLEYELGNRVMRIDDHASNMQVSLGHRIEPQESRKPLNFLIDTGIVLDRSIASQFTRNEISGYFDKLFK